jgi:recombination protein RecA
MSSKKEEVEPNLFEETLKQRFGKDTFQKIKDKAKPNFTGSISLDVACKCPFPKGRIVEIYGNPSSGKTTLSLSVLNEAAGRGQHVGFLDMEATLDDGLLSIFPNLTDENISLMYADYGEKGFEIAIAFVQNYPDSILVIDSVAALVPEKMLSGDVGDATMGAHARLMSDGCRRLVKACKTSGSTVIFLNQVRNTIGGYGNPEITPGGKSLPFYATQRIHLDNATKGRLISDDDKNPIGQKVPFTVVKNKAGAPWATGEFAILFGKGLYKTFELVTLGGLIGVIPMDGAYYLLPNDKGELKKRPEKVAIQVFQSDPELFTTTLKKIQAEYSDIYGQ